MPLYTYRCDECGNELEQFNRITDRHTNAPDCHGPMGIRLHANMGYLKADCHYVCPVTRKPVTTQRQRANIMAEHNLIDANDFKPKAFIAKEEAALAKREKLAGTLKNPLPDREMRELLPRRAFGEC